QKSTSETSEHKQHMNLPEREKDKRWKRQTKSEDVFGEVARVYELNSQPVGLCLIINNENFPNRKVKERRGTNKDAGILADVFSWLGFKVLMCKDQTRDQMEQTLKLFASPHDEEKQLQLQDHGSLHKVCGVDSQPLAIKEIRRYFVATKQPALTGKPKVFLIQACQGDKIQRGVLQKDAEEDSLTSIPEEADFLVAVSTVEDHVSFRDKTNGSWFIQSVCEQLKLHSGHIFQSNFKSPLLFSSTTFKSGMWPVMVDVYFYFFSFLLLNTYESLYCILILFRG
uniref:Caspase family p20 domain-containing protein n=1 Tax=Poecilia latipinna TaxID=48699 RepID=A0A3B3TID4_9TELE